jgi:hypothetical protein
MKFVAFGLTFLGSIAACAAADAQSPAPSSQPAPLAKWEMGEGSLIPRVFQSNPHFDVMIVTELTAAGRKATVASPAQPVYYSGEDGGKVAIGDQIGGDEPPKPADLAILLTKSLRAGGYLPAAPGHPPTIYIYYRWGSFNKLSNVDGGGDIGAGSSLGQTQARPPSNGPQDEMQMRNLMERAALVGGTKFAVEWSQALDTDSFNSWENKSARNEFLVATASDNLYFIIATACDFGAAVQGKVVVLWQTRISTSSRGVAMDETLPQMAASAASFIGHETDGPVKLDRPTIKDGKVDIGDLVVVREELPSDAPNPNNQPPKAQPAAH